MSSEAKKRIILCGPADVRERLSECKHVTFVPYGKPDPAILTGIDPAQTHGVMVHYGSDDTKVIAFVDQTAKSHPDLPCLIFCHEHELKNLGQHGWQTVAVNAKTSGADIEDKLSRALFLFPLVKRDNLRRILSALKKIPPDAENHQKIVRRLQDPEFQVDDVARIIKQDLGLTAQLLKIANSAAFIRERPVQNVSEAVAMLGSAKLQALISSAWAFFLMNDSVCKGFSPKKEWEHANAVADAVDKMCLAQKIPAAVADTAFISAMLHDIGKLLLAANLPLDYSAVLKAGQTKENGVWEAENEMFGFNHAEVGGCLLAMWGIPLPVAEAVLNHHSPHQPEKSPAALILAAHEGVMPKKGAKADSDDDLEWID